MGNITGLRISDFGQRTDSLKTLEEREYKPRSGSTHHKSGGDLSRVVHLQGLQKLRQNDLDSDHALHGVGAIQAIHAVGSEHARLLGDAGVEARENALLLVKVLLDLCAKSKHVFRRGRRVHFGVIIERDERHCMIV